MSGESILDERLTIQDLLDPGPLSEVCQAFSACFNLGLCILDTSGNTVIETGGPWSYCQAFQTQPLTAQRCQEVKKKIALHEISGANVSQIKSFCGFKYAVFTLNYQLDLVGRAVVGPYTEQKVNQEMIKSCVEKYQLPPQTMSEKAALVPVVDSQTLKNIIRLLAKTLDAFIFVNAKRLITTRMHLEAILDSREQIFKHIEKQTSGTPEDRAELEKLKNMF